MYRSLRKVAVGRVEKEETVEKKKKKDMVFQCVIEQDLQTTTKTLEKSQAWPNDQYVGLEDDPSLCPQVHKTIMAGE